MANRRPLHDRDAHGGRPSGPTWFDGDHARGEAYDERFRRLAAAGHDVHGEANFVMRWRPRSVLDAGCGTGRVAIELARRGVEVVGVDIDWEMLRTACAKEPEVAWYQADLATLNVPDEVEVEPEVPSRRRRRRFDLAVMAGNVLLFVTPGSERSVIERVTMHLHHGGILVTGFQLVDGSYGLDDFDADCAAAGLALHERYANWMGDRWQGSENYSVSVHLRPRPEGLGPDEAPETSDDDRGPSVAGEPGAAGVAAPGDAVATGSSTGSSTGSAADR
jgi:SAM-dependent methyltransferase